METGGGSEREREREKERDLGATPFLSFFYFFFHFRESERDLGATPLKRAPAPSSATILLCFFISSLTSQCPSI